VLPTPFGCIPYLIFVEIMDNNIDMKKLRARVGGCHDLVATLQVTKRKKSDSTDTISSQNNSSCASSARVVVGPPSPVPEDPAHSGAPKPCLVADSGVVPTEIVLEVINLEGSLEGGKSSPNHRAKQPLLTVEQPSITDMTTYT